MVVPCANIKTGGSCRILLRLLDLCRNVLVVRFVHDGGHRRRYCCCSCCCCRRLNKNKQRIKGGLSLSLSLFLSSLVVIHTLCMLDLWLQHSRVGPCITLPCFLHGRSCFRSRSFSCRISYTFLYYWPFSPTIGTVFQSLGVMCIMPMPDFLSKLPAGPIVNLVSRRHGFALEVA